MADEETQVREDSLWWASDAAPDTSLSDATFDEPLEWPDALPWEEFGAGEPQSEGFPLRIHSDEPIDTGGVDLLFPPAADPVSMMDADRPAGAYRPPDTGDGGPTELHLESLPDSIWAADFSPSAESEPVGSLGGGIGARATSRTVTIPAGAGRSATDATVVAEPERRPERTSPRWLVVPRGNAAVVALIAFVSLVLLGMFLSVRARNGDVTTDTSATTTPQPTIAANRPLNTIPVSPVTTAPGTPGIALSDLLPPADSTETTTGAPAGAGSVGTTPRATTPATSAAPAQSSTPTGSAGGSGNATQPTTATTAAPDPVVNTTTPPVTSPPSDDTTQTTRKSTPTTEVTWPTYTVPSFTIPTNVTRPTTGR